jgi:hypothetical protein
VWMGKIPEGDGEALPSASLSGVESRTVEMVRGVRS